MLYYAICSRVVPVDHDSVLYYDLSICFTFLRAFLSERTLFGSHSISSVSLAPMPGPYVRYNLDIAIAILSLILVLTTTNTPSNI